MRIAIDASRATVARATGTEHYSRELIRALLQVGAGHEFHLFFRDAPPDGLFSGPRVQQHVIPLPRMWTHLRLAAALHSLRPDVSFVPAHTLPLLLRGPALVTVHDLGFRHFPAAHPPLARRYLELTTRHSARRATLVLADSHATAADLQRFYRIAPEKLRVVYPGVTRLAIGELAALRRKYNLPQRYFLFLGTLQPRKNLPFIVAAWQRWRAANPHDEAGLVLAGGRGWLFDARDFAQLGACTCPATSLTRTAARSTPARWRCSSPRSMRASASPCWKPCTAVRRSSPAAPPACRSWPETPPCWSTRRTRPTSRGR